MAKKAETAAPVKHRKLALYLRPSQVEALADEAHRRAKERGAIRADVSEVAREAVDGWLAKQGRR